MSEKIVDCFFIVEKSDPLKPAGPQSASQENAQYTAADLLSRSWEGRISYMNPVLSTDDLSPSTWIFCLPDGLWFYRKENVPKPTLFTITLTRVDGNMRPVTCLVTYEEFRVDSEVLYSPKCYCILTGHPTGSFARKWLQLFNSKLPEMGTQDIESAITELINANYSNPNVCLNIKRSVFIHHVTKPIKGGLSACDNNAFWLMHSIGIGNIVNIILWLLQEEKVIFVSSNLPLLSQCIETIGALLYPFTWSFLYVTVLPIPLIDYTQSPMPFMIGFLRSAFMSIRRKDIPEGVMIVDLDYGTIMGSNSLLTVPPPHLTKQLFADLHYASDTALGMDDPISWDSFGGISGERLKKANLLIRGAFLRFFASLFRDHRRYIMFLRLLPKPHVHFSSDVYVQSFDEDSKKFVSEIILKQMFLAFAENRPWPIGDSFDIAIKEKVWSIPLKDVSSFISSLVDGTVDSPIFELASEEQMLDTTIISDETKAAYDKVIDAGIPSLVNFRADSLDYLKKSINSQYFRIQFCNKLRDYLHREDRRTWEVSENAGRLIGDFLGFMITESESKHDFLSLKLIATILHKCYYTKGIESRYLCERSGSSQVWKTACVWEEIFCLNMATVHRKLYKDVKIDKDWDKLSEKDVSYYANKEWEETRLEFAFLVSMMESLDVSPIVMRKLMPVVIVNFDENKYQELIELLRPTTMAKLKEMESMEKHPPPKNLANANIIILWVDDKINEPILLANVKAVQDEVQRLKKNINIQIQTFPSSVDLSNWLCMYGQQLSDKIRIVTNRYRQFDGGDKAAELVFKVVREDAKLPTIPVLIYCGNRALAEGIIKTQQYAYADSNIIKLCEFCLNGKLSNK